MTALEDLNLEVGPLDTAEAFLAAWSDPERHWYARRRRHALALTAGLSFDALHPRGRDGRFIEKWGVVRWFDKVWGWRQGIVKDINTDNGEITVSSTVSGDHVFTDPKMLISRPTPKARMNLPEGGSMGEGTGFKKVGGQGGSNPGGFYEVVDSDVVMPGDPSYVQSPDITREHTINRPLKLVSDGPVYKIGVLPDTPVHEYGTMGEDTVVVPRLDGTPNRYDVVTRIDGKWYQVPAHGTITGPEGTPLSSLVQPQEAVFGAPGSERRKALVNDPQGMVTLVRRADVTPDDLARLVQQSASPPAVEGDKFYIKTMNIPERARNEALANAFYEQLGIAVPEVGVGQDGKTVSSKLIGEKVDFDPKNPAHVKAAQDGFVADAWLANWDAVGLTYDNMQVNPDGIVFRVDAGGALLYRAQGKPKGQMFGNDVGELDSLRNPSINAQAASVYGSISEAQLQEQGELLRSITPARITELAEMYDLPDLGPQLIARRESILTQLGIGPVEITEADLPPETPPATSVYNPVEQTMQPGEPPKVAVDNYITMFADLPTDLLTSTDLNDPQMMEDVVLAKNGGLWVSTGPYKGYSNYGEMPVRDLITGAQTKLGIYPGEEFLTGYVKDDEVALEDIADTFKAQRDLAIAEIAAESLQWDSISDAMNNWEWKESYPVYLQPFDVTLYHVDGVNKAIQDGRLPENGPLYNGDTGLAYEIVEATDTTVTLRESGQANPFTINQAGLMNTGPWRMPASDTSVAMVNARLLPAPEEPESTVTLDATIAEAVTPEATSFTDSDPFSDNYTPPPAQVALVTKIGKVLQSDAPSGEKDAALAEYEAAMQAYNAGLPPPPTPTLDKWSGTPPVTPPETETVVVEPPEVAEIEAQIVDAAQPDVSVQIDANSPLLTALGPQEPIFTSSGSNQADDWQHLVGQNVVVMTENHFANPDTTGKMTEQNGLMHVESVAQNHSTVWIRGIKGDGTKVSVGIGPSIQNKKVLIPVAQEPVTTMPLTLKSDGTIWSGKRKIGTWYKPYDYILLPGMEDPALGSQYYSYRAVIDADESITGKPVVVYGNKKSKMRSAVFGYTRPVAPPPTKPKKPAAQKTEAEILKLKQDYAEKITPQVQAQVTQAYTGKYVVPPPGQAPLADGSQPVVGQWVYSPKDSTWWQVVQTDPKLTGKVPGTNLRVRREVMAADGTMTWKESFRGRSTMYAVEGYGVIPNTFLSTNIVTTGDGKQAGPGMFVVTGYGDSWQVMETKGGKVKIKSKNGTVTHWVEAANLTVPSWQTMEVTVVEQKSEAELQALIDLEVAKTVSDNVAEMIAQDLANPGPKKKKAAVTYPGPGGKLVKQNPVYAEQRLAKGLQVLADGYAPQVGQVLRHKDGTRYIVIQVGAEWKPSQKNSVEVIPEGSTNYWNGKWRALSTLVVDHEAMLTDKDGSPLPAIKEIQHPLPDGTDLPNGSFIWRVDTEKFHSYDDQGKARYKTHSEYYAVAPDGKAYNVATGKPIWNSSKMYATGTRVGYIDKDAGDQVLTVTVDDPSLSYPNVVGFAVLNPDENPAAAMAGKTGVPKAKPAPPIPTTQITLPQGQVVKVGDTVNVAGVSDEPVQVVAIDGDTLIVGGDGGPTVSVNKHAVQPITNDQFVSLKDGTKVYVGQVVNYYGTQMLVTAVDTNGNLKLQTPEDEDFGWINAEAMPGITGISPPNPDVPPITPESTTLTDGTVVTVGDTIVVNGKTGDVVNVDTLGEILVEYEDGTQVWASPGIDKIGSGQGTSAQPSLPGMPEPTPVEQPTVIQAESTGVDLTGDLPPFEGIIGQELAHPPIKSSAQGAVPVFSPTYAGAPLDQKPTAVTGAKVRSVMDAVAETIQITESNKSGDRDWPSVYALADRDAIDDMLVQTQVVRDGKGQDFVEVRFRLNNAAADNARSQLLVKGGGQEFGDWVKDPVNPKNLVLGDQISVKVSSQNDKQLKPNDVGFPNATVAGGPTLIGKSEDGKFDVYRVEVAFTNGASGVLELQDRLGPSINTFAWDENKVRQTNGALSLNPTAKNDGWSVRYTALHYDRAGGGQSMEWDQDGAKKLGGSPGEQVGSGHVLEWSGNGTWMRYASASKNSMDGMTVIRVPADDPDAQAKISAAMERVGITPEQQKPPDADALTFLALNKVFKQFSPTYIRGQQTNATPDNPESVLALVDKAVGVNMPGQRKVTMADISIAVTPDGWAQVLVSEDVARAIVKTNGVKHYFHRFTEKSAEVANVMPMSGESTGLMASTERWSNGLFYFGMSSQSDHSHDSANRLFLRASKSNSHSSSGGTIMVLDAVTMHRMVDYYWQPGDRFGDRNSNNLNFLNMGSLAGGNEIMIKRRIDARLWGRVLVSSARRDAIIAALHKRGITHAPNGLLLEDFYIVGSVDNKDILPGDYGDEVAIPDLAAAVVV